MTVALLSIGTELVRGEIANTNAAWLAAQLTGMGFDVAALESVADDEAAMAASLRRLMHEQAIVIVTGGLGPTTDDLTAKVAAAVAGVPLELHGDALAAIRRRLEQRGRELRPGHEKQAWLPAGCEILPNAEGTAPGFVTRNGRSVALYLPGVPAEMQRMFEEQVAPRIRGSAPNTSFQVVLRTVGVGESVLDERLAGLEAEGLTLGYRVHEGEVDVKVLGRGASYAQARERAELAATEVRARLGAAVYGEVDDTLALVAGRAVRSRGWRMAAAESCTGGLVSRLITRNPGASEFFVGSAVTYANTAKASLLGVSEDTLRGHGAVSAEVAAEMAEGARSAFGCELGVATTGIAGPSGATPDKPVGLCYWAVAFPGQTVVEHRVLMGNREQIQLQASKAALDLVRRSVLGCAPEARPSRAGE
ncbi:MAG: competence/damage-inducible protein A [Myxococcales bacterium]|nr:competence/damage-inducible protein A [Myxococcales bacterium]